MNEENYLSIIKKSFKEPIQEYKVHSGTYGNVVFEINKDWIFRFSREARDIKQLAIEKNFLPKFEKISSLPVPHIKYQGEGFIGYKKLMGEPFTEEICANISIQQREDIWKAIGEFLSQLHAINFIHENLVPYPFGDNDFWKDLWSPIAPQLSVETREKAFKYFTEYFTEESNYFIKKTICHADFHPNHILFNPQTKNISGIIDFGRICINDPAVDFNLIERIFGDKAINSVLKYYTSDVSKNFRARITFQNRRRLLAAFFHAKLIGETASFPRYLERVEEVFSN